MIIFPDCTADNARVVLERIKLHFSDQGVAAAGQKWWISGGCAELLPGEQNADKIGGTC
jgi:PleD family two-component response regulator